MRAAAPTKGAAQPCCHQLPATVPVSTLISGQVMEVVELASLRTSRVGIPGVSGLSVEQRKRLTIAVELVANPSIVFMVRRRCRCVPAALALAFRRCSQPVASAGLHAHSQLACQPPAPCPALPRPARRTSPRACWTRAPPPLSCAPCAASPTAAAPWVRARRGQGTAGGVLRCREGCGRQPGGSPGGPAPALPSAQTALHQSPALQCAPSTSPLWTSSPPLMR